MNADKTNVGGFWRRLRALVRKESQQMLRDRSNLAVGLVLPLTLILLFGYGLSFDVDKAPITVVMEDSSPQAREVVSGLWASHYLSPQWSHDYASAREQLRQAQVDAILRVPSDFSRRLAAGNAQVQLLQNGVDANSASIIEGYVNGALANYFAQQSDRQGKVTVTVGQVNLISRVWFNEAGNSTWYLVPGLLALVMTLIGAFLTSLLIAREWERGTLESLFVTPVRPLELVLAKLAPYMLVGAIDLVLCLLAAKFLFEVPMRGSLWMIILASLLYLGVALMLGLFISGRTRNQFEASQMALLVSFMPALMLSGFVFDLRNVPLVVQFISQVLPATHFMSLIKTLFLAGDNWWLSFTQCGILCGFLIVLTVATTRTVRKQLD